MVHCCCAVTGDADHMDNPPPSCPDDATWRRLLDPGESGTSDPQLAAHLESCARCRTRLEELAGGPVGLKPSNDPDHPKVPAELRKFAEQIHASGAAAQPGAAIGDFSSEHGTDPGRHLFLGPPGRPDSIGTFGGHEILERIGAGGMGIVFKALDPQLNRMVAIKALAPALAASTRARNRFLREARAAAAVVHENVVAIHAVGEENRVPYLVMQFVQGRSLEVRLRAGPLALAQILRIGLQTAAALAAAHAQGLIHRDVKPGNILLENGVERVKLTDFGLARAVDEPGVTRAGTVTGTPEYMSPEQARGDRIDARSDLFSLGAVLHTAATGTSPFAGSTVYVVLRNVCELEPPRLGDLRPELPVWFGELVSRLLQKDPADRIQSAAELVQIFTDRLAAVQAATTQDTSTEPRRPSPGSGPKKDSGPPRRHRGRWLTIAALATLLAFAIGGVRLWQRFGTVTDRPTFTLLRPDGSTVHAPSLERAIEAARAGDIVEVAGAGVVECDPMRITGKPLRIRAALTGAPTLVARSTNAPLLFSTSPLVIEGLELRARDSGSDLIGNYSATAPGGVPTQLDQLALASQGTGTSHGPDLIRVVGASFFAGRCRFVGSSNPRGGEACVRIEDSPIARLSGCEFYRAGGAAVVWNSRPSGGGMRSNRSTGQLYIEHCGLVSAVNVLFEIHAGGSTHFTALRNSMVGLVSMAWLGAGDLEIRADRNEFDALQVARRRTPAGWVSMRRFFEGGTTNYFGIQHAASAVMRGRTANESFPNIGTDTEPGAQVGPPRLVPSLRAAGTNRLTASIFRLPTTTDETKPVPSRTGVDILGADVDTLGPGSGYHRWRTTNDYQTWLEASQAPR